MDMIGWLAAIVIVVVLIKVALDKNDGPDY